MIKMSPKETLAFLEKYESEALLYEPRPALDRALIGVTQEPKDHWPREPGPYVAVYAWDTTVEVYADDLEMGWEDASDWVSFNTAGAYVGRFTPWLKHSHCDGCEE